MPVGPVSCLSLRWICSFPALCLESDYSACALSGGVTTTGRLLQAAATTDSQGLQCFSSAHRKLFRMKPVLRPRLALPPPPPLPAPTAQQGAFFFVDFRTNSGFCSRCGPSFLRKLCLDPSVCGSCSVLFLPRPPIPQRMDCSHTWAEGGRVRWGGVSPAVGGRATPRTH